MIEYLDLDDLLHIARRIIGGDVKIRDYGLLISALARPRAWVFGHDAYADLPLKAAALLHSLVRNHTLVEGNRRLGWIACLTFLAVNGQWVRATEDDRVDFVIRVATGDETDLADIAGQLREWCDQAR